jgi:hypothetical protein
MPARLRQSSTRIIPPRRLRRLKVRLSQRNLLDAVYRMAKMSRRTKFITAAKMGAFAENLPDFHGAKTYLTASIHYHANYEQ